MPLATAALFDCEARFQRATVSKCNESLALIDVNRQLIMQLKNRLLRLRLCISAPMNNGRHGYLGQRWRDESLSMN
jgi:hypothetical protein